MLRVRLITLASLDTERAYENGAVGQEATNYTDEDNQGRP